MTSIAPGGLALLLFIISVILAGLLCFAFWIWMLVDCATREPSQGNDRLVWILVIVLTNVIGALIYFFARRPRRKVLCGS